MIKGKLKNKEIGTERDLDILEKQVDLKWFFLDWDQIYHPNMEIDLQI